MAASAPVITQSVGLSSSSNERFLTSSGYLPLSAERLMSSKKMPHKVGEIGWPGWATSTVIFAGWALAERTDAKSAMANRFVIFMKLVCHSLMRQRQGISAKKDVNFGFVWFR